MSKLVDLTYSKYLYSPLIWQKNSLFGAYSTIRIQIYFRRVKDPVWDVTSPLVSERKRIIYKYVPLDSRSA